MAYKEYNHLSSPNEVLEAIASYIKEKGYDSTRVNRSLEQG